MLNHAPHSDTARQFNDKSSKVFYPITFDNRTRLWQYRGKSHTDFNSAFTASKE